MTDLVTCLECNKMFKRVTYKHLKHHDMTLDDYIIKYPDAPLISQSTLNGLRTNSLEHFIKIHGAVKGPTKYEEYKNFQSSKNTFEYKQKKYGWSKEQFDEYNSKRAVTKKNLIAKHGNDKGLQIWNEYVQKQKTNGNTLEWFVNKLGIDVGTAKFLEVNRQKALTLDNFIRKYGDSEGELRYNEYVTNGNVFSNVECEFVDRLSEVILDTWETYSYKNNQYCIYDEVSGKNKYYDYVIFHPIKYCIEFHGDYWHCNPSKYTNEYYHTFKKQTAKEIWDDDKYKQQIIENHQFKYTVVWENDWYTNPDEVINNIVREINQLVGNE
jgi:hypothetical protein